MVDINSMSRIINNSIKTNENGKTITNSDDINNINARIDSQYVKDDDKNSNLLELFALYQRLAKTNDSNAAEVLDLYEEIVESQCREEMLRVYPFNLIKTPGANQDLHLAVRELSRRVMSAVEMDRSEPDIKELALKLAEELGWIEANSYKEDHQKKEGIQRRLLNITDTVDEIKGQRGLDVIERLLNTMEK